MSVLSLPSAPADAHNGDMYYNTVEQEYYNFVDGEWVKQVNEDNATTIVQEVVVDEGYIKNTATGEASITIGGTPAVSPVKNAVNIGVNSTATRTGATAVGMTALAESANGTAIGNGAKVLNNSNKAIALGYHAFVVGAESAIQIGNGTNSTPKTLSVGFYDETNPVNYELLSADGTIPTGRYKTMVGANGTNAGTTGAVPAPTATDNTKFLRGDGTWEDALTNIATHDKGLQIENVNVGGRGSYALTTYGKNIKAMGPSGVIIGADSNVIIGSSSAVGITCVGYGCTISNHGIVHLGAFGANSTAGTFSVSLSSDGQRANSNTYTVMDATGKIPGARMSLQDTTAPTTSTVGTIGQFYVDTTNQTGYMCVGIDDTDPNNVIYTWKQITV